jgi:hypothetical protein
VTITKAGSLLDTVTSWRRLRADVAAAERRCARIRQQIQAVEHLPRSTRQRVNLPPLPLVEPEPALPTAAIIHARRVLAREALNVFGVTRSSIAGLLLPSVEHFEGESS